MEKLFNELRIQTQSNRFLILESDDLGGEDILFTVMNTDSDSEQKANILASAPELLEALQEMVEMAKWIPKETFTQNGISQMNATISQAKAAINKATGSKE